VFVLSGAAEAMPNTADQLPQNLDAIKRAVVLAAEDFGSL
jgi:hypothetical protein